MRLFIFSATSNPQCIYPHVSHWESLSLRVYTAMVLRYRLQKLWGKWLRPRFGYANHLSLIAYLCILLEVVVERKLSELGTSTLNDIWDCSFTLPLVSPIENEDITCSPQYNMLDTRTNEHRALPPKETKLVRCLILRSSQLYWKHVPYDSCTSLIRVLYFISIFLDWRLGSNQPFNWKVEIW